MLQHHTPATRSQDLAIYPLPVPLTSFIGRQPEMAQVKHLLASSRLVTLTGAGGCGKTRLALHVACDLRQNYPDGVCWVDLAPLADATLLLQAIAQALHIMEQARRPLLDVILDFLHDKRLLLVLDNCEHLASACAEFAHDALCEAPRIHLLATSREPLAVIGEMLYPVAPLALPPPSQATDIGAFDAIRLFIERARDVLPNFALTTANTLPVANICRRLDGIPLAIELASARVNALTVEQIAARLDDRFALLTSTRHGVPSHHRTLRAALDWSYGWLPAQEQTLLRRLSVFAGGCTLEAVEHICAAVPSRSAAEGSDGIAPEQIMDGLSSLVNKSLVGAETLKAGEARYRILESVRQYAQEKLEEAGEGETIRNRHLDYFLDLAQSTEYKLHGPKQYGWLERLDAEHDNLRTALEWSLGVGRAENGLRLATALLWYWDMRAYWSEGSEQTRRLLDRTETAPKTLTRANALFLVARMISPMGDEDKSCRPYLEAAIAIAREQGNDGKRWLALCLGFLGFNLFGDDPAASESIIGEGLAIGRALGDEWALGLLLTWRGVLFAARQDYASAHRALEESVSRFERAGDRHQAAITSNITGWVYSMGGNLAQARQAFEKNLPFFRETKDRHYTRMALQNLGEISLKEGRSKPARKYCEEALLIARQIGNKFYIILGSHILGLVALREGELTQGKSLFAESLALGSELGLRYEISVKGLASIAVMEKKAQRAVRLFASMDAISETRMRIRNTRSPEIDLKAYLGMARDQLGDAAFNQAWEEGKQMTWEQAVQYALNEEPAAPEAQGPTQPTYPAGLTEREVEVLRWLARGLTNQEIATKLVLSRRTVHAHLRSVYSKLDVTTRNAATRVAIENKII